jgi:hypothetical protein
MTYCSTRNTRVDMKVLAPRQQENGVAPLHFFSGLSYFATGECATLHHFCSTKWKREKRVAEGNLLPNICMDHTNH